MALSLPRLGPGQPIVTPYLDAHTAFSVAWQRLVEALEAQEASQDQVIADLAVAVANITTAQNAANAAQTAANTAQTAAVAADARALAARREDSRTSSYTSPTDVLTAADVGTTTTITIAAHTRAYPGVDVADLSILSATLTGLAFSTKYYVYYDDTTLADTTPNFLSTTSSATAHVAAAVGRHLVGTVTTPADGAAATTGSGGLPPGSDGAMKIDPP